MQTGDPSRSRAETTTMIVVIMLGALGLNYAMTSTTESAEHRKGAMSKHIRERQCVVADMQGRYPSLYVCQLPVANEYLEAGALEAEARAHHPKG